MSGIFGRWDDSFEHLVHLLVAFFLALPIGWNRSREERGAGIRTLPLVAMVSCGFVQTALSVLGPTAATQANILQGVITGVGFIGAGAIMRQSESRRPAMPQRPVFGRLASSALQSDTVTSISGSSLQRQTSRCSSSCARVSVGPAVPPDALSDHHRD